MHPVSRIGAKVAGRGLLDVGHAFEGAAASFLYLCQEVQEVAHVAALFVEIEGVCPVGNGAFVLCPGGDGVDVADAVHVPVEVVAVEFDFEVGETVRADPFRQGLGQAVVQAMIDVGVRERVQGAHEVVERHSR